MRYLNGYLLIAILILATLGCGNGKKPSTATQTPTVEQVQQCRKIMYINPDLKIIAKGHCHDEGFQDDAIHFKFTTDAESVDDIFQADVVPSIKFKSRGPLGAPRYELAKAWWKPSPKSLIGGDFIVPDLRTGADRGLHIGIESNADGTFTVYASWFEI